MNKKEIFGKRFKEIRKRFGYTQERMAEIAGIEPQSISKIESGKNFPLLTNLDKIAEKLGIELEDFFCYEHKVEPDKLKGSLIDIFDTLEQSDKEKLLRIARVLKV
ncbi:MAG: helix-turn-helix domain-containing protein [Candidatus Gastranaerophilales bacterium]|nr:helix-turn-helix domain-containing protein [Candidatus Gastranaerophilales bacterium]